MSDRAMKAVEPLCTCYDKGADGTHAIGCIAPKAAALLDQFAAEARSQQVRTDCGRLHCWVDGTGARAEEVLDNPNLDEDSKQLARTFLYCQQRIAAITAQAQKGT